MPNVATIPFQLAMQALPPRCASYPAPTLPNGADRCAEPWIEVYDVPCTPEAFECLMFRSRHYSWRQRRLLALVNRRPRPTANATAKYDWCRAVLQNVVALADDTNIAPGFLSGFGVPHHFTRTKAFLETINARYAGEAVPLMFPEIWRTESPSGLSALGANVLGHLGARVDTRLGAYLWMPAGRTSTYMLEHVQAQHEVERPRPIPITLETRDVQPRDLTLHIFEQAPRSGQYLLARIERATGSAPCLASPSSRFCFHYERFATAVAGAEATMDLLQANAYDWLNTPFRAAVDAGLARYATYLVPFAEAGTLPLTPDELRAQATEAKRREAQAMIGSAGGTAAAVATAFNPIVGAAIAAIAALLTALLEALPVAYGGGGCPVMGFRRTLIDPECAVPNPQGSGGTARRNLDVPSSGLAPSLPTTPSVAPPVRRRSKTKASTWVGLTVAATAVATAAAVLHARRSNPDATQEEDEP